MRKFKQFLKDAGGKILILDFGSKKISDLTNKIRQERVFCEVHPFTLSIDDIREFGAAGIILSGSSVMRSLTDKTQESSKEIYDLGIPILGICYGLEMIAKQLGGEVSTVIPETGIVEAKIERSSKLFNGFKDSLISVWMHHEDQVSKLPAGFITTASTKLTKNAAIEHPSKKIFGVQFHPEGYSRDGTTILGNFLRICGCTQSLSLDFKDHFFTGKDADTLNK